MSDPASTPPADSKRVLAGVLGILFGGLGLQRFVMGIPKAD